jgi:hypothetical protein
MTLGQAVKQTIKRECRLSSIAAHFISSDNPVYQAQSRKIGKAFATTADPQARGEFCPEGRQYSPRQRDGTSTNSAFYVHLKQKSTVSKRSFLRRVPEDLCCSDGIAKLIRRRPSQHGATRVIRSRRNKIMASASSRFRSKSNVGAG